MYENFNKTEVSYTDILKSQYQIIENNIGKLDLDYPVQKTEVFLHTTFYPPT